MVLFDPTQEANERRRAHAQTANQGVLEGANTQPDVALAQYTPVEVMEKEHVFFLFKGLLEPLLKRLERSDEHLEHMLEELWRWRSFVDTPVFISANVFYEIDYKERMFVFCYTPVAITLAAPGGWTQALPAFQWSPVMLPRGTHVTAQGLSDATPQGVLFRACDEWITGNVSILAGTSSIGNVTLNPNVGVNIGQVSVNNGGNSQNSSATSFWNAAVVGAGGVSAIISIPGYGKVRIFVSTSVADTFNVQISDDGGVTWYTLTQDNAGTPVIIATTATQLNSCRDIQTFGGTNIRLLAIGAATITAGHQAEKV